MKPVKPIDLVAFDSEKRCKTEIYRTAGLLVGVDGFEPGQAHRAHVHDRQEKVWWVLEGKGTVELSGVKQPIAAGELVVIPAGVEHGIEANLGERMVVAVILAPGPSGSCG